MGPPTLAGFTAFVVTALGLSPLYQADPGVIASISMAYAVAVDIVNLQLQSAANIYTLAVYNLGVSNVINFAQDPANAPLLAPLALPGGPQNGQQLALFASLRAIYGTANFSAGVVQATGDQGTNTSLIVQEAMKNITLSDLQLLKDPWGRRYLAFAQKYGPTVWGVT